MIGIAFRFLGGQNKSKKSERSSAECRTPYKERLMYRLILLAVTVMCFNAGCALEKAMDASSDLVRSAGIAIVENSDAFSAQASGSASNPKYRIMAGMFQGVIAEISLDGVQVDANLTGQGAGTSNPAIEALLSNDITDEAAISIFMKMRSASQEISTERDESSSTNPAPTEPR